LLDHQRWRQPAHALRTPDLQVRRATMGEVARGRATLAIRRRGPRSRDRQERRDRPAPCRSARGSSTRSTTDLVSMPPWAISARNSSSTAPAHGQISGLIDARPAGATPVSRSRSSSLRASRGSAGASDKDRYHRRRDVASHFDGWAKGRASSLFDGSDPDRPADEEARRAYREWRT
jgi:hypothetical protein